jgi:hypothetical protein
MGQGNIQKTGYLHFELWNCGNNVPQIQGNSFAIVAQQFDMRPNPTTGLISGSIYGEAQILCGNTHCTVTEYKDERRDLHAPGSGGSYLSLAGGAANCAAIFRLFSIIHCEV